jgi:NAD(P)-dependent dehydrogenase (short-subunit alcohol dehydrogenase family)
LLRREEALGSVDRFVADVDRWEQAHLKKKGHSHAKAAKREYDSARRLKFFHGNFTCGDSGRGGLPPDRLFRRSPPPINTETADTKGKNIGFMLTRTISVELAKDKITVNNIGPGAAYTPIDADIEARPEIEKSLMGEIPPKRWGTPEEIAGLAVYLASDESAYVTGSTFFIDGGMLRQAGSY